MPNTYFVSCLPFVNDDLQQRALEQVRLSENTASDNGQSVSFLGYPFGWDGGGEHINRGVPLPFAKAGVVSALEFGDAKRIILDAHGNKGFSGGPVVFVPHEQPNGELHVAGIVSHFPTSRHWQNWLPVVDREGSPIIDHQGNPLGYVRDNPGIVVAFSINHAKELIDANPIGFQLPR